MAIQQNDTGKSSTYGRGLMSYISQRLPYTYQEASNIEEKNPKYKIFQKNGAKRAEALANNSVAISSPEQNSAGAFSFDNSLARTLYANVNQDKGGRMRDYRVMAA